MAARFPAQDAAREREPQAAPETPRRRGAGGAAINDLVRKLRDELGLAIVPRDQPYSPSQHNKSPGDILYNRIQTLYWREKDALYAAIEECKSELAGHSTALSAEERTDLVLTGLRDPARFADNRIHQPSHRASSTITRTSSDPEPVRRLFRRVDRAVGPPSPSASPSPLVTMTMPGNASKSSTNIRDSFWSRGSSTSDDTKASTSRITSATTSANTSFTESLMGSTTDEGFDGSSMSFSQVEDPTADPESSEGQFTESITPTTSLGRSPAKRRRPDGSENHNPRLTKKVRHEPQQDSEIPKSKPHLEDNNKQRHHQITALATSGHSIEHPYVYDRSKSFAASFERARIMCHAGFTNEQVSSVKTHNDASALLANHNGAPFQHSPPSIWNLPNATHMAAEDTKLVLSATAKFNAKNDTCPMFQWNLNPIRKETNSTHLERRLGFDRFLTITFPSLIRDLPTYLQGQRDELFSAFMDWILKPKFFLGRVWRVFFSKEHENKAFKKKVIDNSRDRGFYFFAVSGDGIGAPMTYFDFMNWMIPFKENAAQSAYKLFARIPLYLSRTTPTFQFRYDQIRFVDDVYANGAPEATTFEDPVFKNARRKRFDKAEVMTDGCSRISVGALKEISKISGMPYCHGAIQARINGHKGLWIPSAPENTKDPDHLAIWIELRPSQAKLKIRSEDRDVSLCEKDRWSFNVVKQTRPHRCSVLHRDFLQLLEERHVPRAVLLSMIEERIKFPIEEWSAAMGDPARWVVLREKHFCFGGTQQTLEFGLPYKDAAKTEMLVDEAGFEPRECHPLAKTMQRMQEMFFQQFRSRLSFLCPKSTYLHGVPDPEDVLEPGEVHLSLTQPFVDEATEEICDTGTFKDTNVLITRHPSGLRSSDMQKVRCICHPSLAHLKDVIVMSTRGAIPLAAKLQGGDYDGDEFWICADTRIVEPFQNVPVLEQLGPDDLGIIQKTDRLMDIIDGHQLSDDQKVESWLRVALPFACQEQQLGVVTNRLNELAYHRSLTDQGVCLLADLHDLIIDTNKNGYVFNKQGFTNFCRKHKEVNLDLPRKGRPAYLENIDWAKPETNLLGTTEGNLRSIVAPRGKPPSRHILDVVVFKCMNPKIYEHLKYTHETYVEPALRKTFDEDLQWVLQTCPIELTVNDKSQLDGFLELAYEKWGAVNNSRRTSSRTNEDHAKAWQDCIETYKSIRPPGPDDPFWKVKHGPAGPTYWDCYKVGVLASKRHYLQKKTFMFRVAADTVCHLKSLSTNGRKTIERAAVTKKARKPKDWATIGTHNDSKMQDVDGNDDDDDDDNESMFGFDEGAFDAFG